MALSLAATRFGPPGSKFGPAARLSIIYGSIGTTGDLGGRLRKEI